MVMKKEKKKEEIDVFVDVICLNIALLFFLHFYRFPNFQNIRDNIFRML